MENKKIVIFSPEFFGIEKAILLDLKSDNNDVKWFDERPFKSAFKKAISLIFPWIFKRESDKYFIQCLKKCNLDTDCFLIVKGEMVSKKVLKIIKERFKSAKLILYLWDSIRNIKGIKKKFVFYDKVFSFDSRDCKKNNLIFRPLFSDIYVNETKKDHYLFDICFFGTMYGDRFYIVDYFEKECKKRQLSFYAFRYLRGRFIKLFYFFVNKGYRKTNKNKISFSPKTSKEISEIVSNSKIVLDINDKNQSGLTIRTFESLFSHKKIITTNSNIVNYDFFDDNNILVIDRKCPIIPDDFLETKFKKIDERIMHKYTSRGWIEDVFDKI